MCHGQIDLDILFVKLTTQIGYCNWKIPSAHCVSGVGDSMQCLFLFEISCKVPQLHYRALLGLPSCESDPWRRYTCTNVLLVREGEVGELVQPGGMWGLPWSLLNGTGSGRKEVCMVPCHSCHMYGIWTKSSFEGGDGSHKRGTLL